MTRRVRSRSSRSVAAGRRDAGARRGRGREFMAQDRPFVEGKKSSKKPGFIEFLPD